MRTGLITTKLGMSRVFDENGKAVPVTVLQVRDCQVVQTKTVDAEGYNAVQLGMGAKKASRTNKPLAGHFAKANVEPKQYVREFKVSKENLLEVGTELKADYFEIGAIIDAQATTIGKGFQGGIKRHNFGGLRATHGVSVSHRSLGSTGQCQDPGKVFKGKKMAGHMGHKLRTQQNLEVVEFSVEDGLILVKGSVPGAKGGVVLVKDAIKMLNK